MLIDGEMFEEVQSITVSTRFAPAGYKDFTIPVKTFLPFRF